MSPHGAVSGSEQSTSGSALSPTAANRGGKVVNAKRGRKQDDSLPPSRARDVQRAFRARRAEQLSALEDQVRVLQQENTELKRELVYYKGETSYPVASTSTSHVTAAGASTLTRSTTTESAATSARTSASISPGPRSRRVKRTRSSSKDPSPASTMHEDTYKEEASRASYSLGPVDATLDNQGSRSTSRDHHPPAAAKGSQDKLWGLDTTAYASQPAQQMYTPPPSAAAAVSSAPPWSHASYSTLPQQGPAEAVVSPKMHERPSTTPLSLNRRRLPSTTVNTGTDSPINTSTPSASNAPADPKTNSAAFVLVEWSKQASVRSCSNVSSACCAPSVPAPSADLTAQELCGPSADADCCQPPPAVASTIEVRTPVPLNEDENGTRHHLLSFFGGPEGNTNANANAKWNVTANIKNITYDPNLCCGGLIDCSGPLFESSGLSAEEAHALAEASQALESGAVA